MTRNLAEVEANRAKTDWPLGDLWVLRGSPGRTSVSSFVILGLEARIGRDTSGASNEIFNMTRDVSRSVCFSAQLRFLCGGPFVD